ncbi:MAG: hypothetical protein KGL44_09235 [Sphingomonadales bacterium]|nr:hypothetical protein [Sphingomonadales bacterium]
MANMRKSAALAGLGLIMAGAATPALACSPVNTVFSDEMVRQSARNAVREARAIVDVQVVRVVPPDARGNGGYTRMRVVRMWKGPVGPVIDVAANSTCDIAYWQPRGFYRLLLDGGPARYSASIMRNGHGGGDPRVFDRMVDSLLGAPRPLHYGAAGVMVTPPRLPR